MKLQEYVEGKMLEGEDIGVGQLAEVCEKLLVEAYDMVDRSFLGKLEKKLVKEKL